MIDLKNVENYRENNRIEAKKALGGLPKSIWETYSAFANTLGGVILLGVREDKDKTLHPVHLPNPERLIDEFWTIINDKTKISANILTQKHVAIVEAEDKQFIAISVPRASRRDRPIYIGTDPLLGSYRRNGEGDYRCSVEEIKGMLRDATVSSKDMRPLAHLNMDAFDTDTVEQYRQAVIKIKPHIPLKELSVNAFLEKIGAAIRDNDGVLRPSAAGLLMLGKTEKIKEVYPFYRVRYEDYFPDFERGKCDNDNLFSFFTYANERITTLLAKMDVEAQTAATETLINCLVNADYHARSGIYVTYKRMGITYSNPGGFRLPIHKAKNGGVSDPRNMGLLRLFQQIGWGNGTGSGIPSIFSSWGKNNRGVPVIQELFHPERVSVLLPFSREQRKKNNVKTALGKNRLVEEQERAIIDFLTDMITASINEICDLLHISAVEAKALLDKLTEEEVLRCEKNRYALKS